MSTPLRAHVADVPQALDRIDEGSRAAAVTLRRENLADLGGRWFAILLAVSLAAVVSGDIGVGWLMLAAGIWLVAIQTSFATNAQELLALGTGIATASGTLVGLVSVAGAAFLFDVPNLTAPTLVAAGALVFVAVVAWDAAFRRLVARPRRILIVGSSNGGQDIVRELAAMPDPRFAVVGFVGDDAALDSDVDEPVLGAVEDLGAVIKAKCPDIIVVALERNRPAVFAQLLESADADFRVVEAAQFCEHAFGRVPVRDISRAWFMSVLHLYQRPYSRFAKRLFDIVVASVGLLVLLPLVPFLAVAVKTSKGPLVFRQVRVGGNGVPFTIYKFRTMRADAEQAGHALWAQEHDPRVTRVGRVMRRLRLDEIPQLWNVLRGDMSIVGPRPERPEFLAFLEQRVPFWSRRQLVKPGITGWAQVRRGYTADADGSVDKLSYDLWYLRHRSLLVDVAICMQTLRVLLFGGTHEPRAASHVDVVDAAEPIAAWPERRSSASGSRAR